MSTTYTLHIENKSNQTGNFCIFQEAPDVNVPGIMTLAWLAKPAHPTTTLLFEWTTTTNLAPGTRVIASQSWMAHLNTGNRITFSKEKGAYTFQDRNQGDYEGHLYIEQTNRVNSFEASVGIGMGGKPTFMVQSQPNMQLMFTPKPTYWVAFGSFEEGEVLDIGKVTMNAMKLSYAERTNLEVTFKGCNCWE